MSGVAVEIQPLSRFLADTLFVIISGGIQQSLRFVSSWFPWGESILCAVWLLHYILLGQAEFFLCPSLYLISKGNHKCVQQQCPKPIFGAYTCLPYIGYSHFYWGFACNKWKKWSNCSSSVKRKDAYTETESHCFRSCRHYRGFCPLHKMCNFLTKHFFIMRWYNPFISEEWIFHCPLACVQRAKPHWK